MRKHLVLMAFSLFAASAARAEFTSLNLGLDYHLRGVSIGNNDMSDLTSDSFSYYSQSARMYMRAWLNEDVEAAFRLQSLNVWGLEGSGTPVTRYPKADGTPFVEEAYIHMPHMLRNHLDLTVGRQPLVLGDGMLVSSDDVGFNALRARFLGPWQTELDLFTAKMVESLSSTGDDSDLKGVVFRVQQADRHWDVGMIQESNSAVSTYVLGTSTYAATQVNRRFYDVRLFGDLKDAYYKVEVAMQEGDAQVPGVGAVKIKGIGQKIELGAQKDTDKWGRFGVRAIYAQGSGDNPNSLDTDEAFRPTFARRWSGLQRAGYGAHYAATLSDAYDPAAPFSPDGTGLPLASGVSGIRTTGLGIHSTQKVFWTGSLDYYTYDARVNSSGEKDLGAEIDAQLTYRYTGFVTFTGGMSLFFPGGAYGTAASRVTRTFFETHVHF